MLLYKLAVKDNLSANLKHYVNILMSAQH